MDDKIYFSLSGYWHFFKLNMEIIDLYENNREVFYDNVVIDSFYDSFPCIWNGGRTMSGTTNLDNIIATVRPYNERGYSLRHTFTNCLIDEKILSDYTSNLICKLTESELNGVNCNSELLANYIKENYPKFYILWSTTLCITDINEINSKSKNNLLVLDYNLNNNFEVLKQIKNKQNIEILVGEGCVDNCPYREEHYKNVSEYQMMLTSSPFRCPHAKQRNGSWNFYSEITKRNHYISVEDINNKYLPIGFNKFKISGRYDGLVTGVERCVHYLIKPEYKDEIRSFLLMNLIY